MLNILTRPFKDLENRKITGDYITCEKSKTPHTATDYAMTTGTSIYAPANMVVTVVNLANGEMWLDFSPHQNWDYKGKCIKLRTMVVAHCSAIYFNIGDVVKEGQEIAKSGSKGVSTGPHLHLSFHDVDRQSINPESVVGFILAQEDLQGQLDTIKTKQEEIDTLQRGNGQLTDRVIFLEDEVSDLEEKIDEQQITIEEKDKEIGELTMDIIRLSEDKDILYNKLEKAAIKIANQAQEVKKLTAALEKCKENNGDCNILIVIIKPIKQWLQKLRK